jgi:gas vesicle protein
MARYDDDAGSGLPWFLFGIGLGAALGLLLAPQTGAETRRALGKRARKLRDLAEDQFEEVVRQGRGKARDLRRALAEAEDAEALGDDGDEAEPDAPRPSRAREELERRLAAARARRRGARTVAEGAGPADEDAGA